MLYFTCHWLIALSYYVLTCLTGAVIGPENNFLHIPCPDASTGSVPAPRLCMRRRKNLVNSFDANSVHQQSSEYRLLSVCMWCFAISFDAILARFQHSSRFMTGNSSLYAQITTLKLFGYAILRPFHYISRLVVSDPSADVFQTLAICYLNAVWLYQQVSD